MATNGRAEAVQHGDPQLQLLRALLRDDIVTFQGLLNDSRVNPRHLYTKPEQGTCLDVAAKTGRKDFVSALLQRFETEPVQGPILPPPAHLAARGGHAETLAALLAVGSSTIALDQYGRTALHYTCYYASETTIQGYENCVQKILRNFSIDDLNRKDKFGYTAIHLTASEAVDGFKNGEILEGESNTDGSSDDGKWRAKRRIAEILLHLSKDVLDLDSLNGRGFSARQALTRRFPSIYPLLPLRTELLPDPHKRLIESIRKGQIEIFRALLYKSDANDNPTLDPNHWFNAPINATILELACCKTEGEQFVRILLDCGADPDIPSKWNFKFPIHIACERGDPEILYALVNHSTTRANLNSTDAQGNTALHYLARTSNDESVHYIGKGDFSECLEILLKHDELYVNRVNDNGDTPLHLALGRRNKEFVKEILRKKSGRIDLDVSGCSRNIRDWLKELYPDLVPTVPSGHPNRRYFAEPEEIKLLELLKKRREEEVVRYLAEQPMQASVGGDRHNTPLQYAARFGMDRATNALLSAGADPTKTFEGNKSPPIVLASYYGHRNVLGELLRYNNNDLLVNNTDNKGNSALHYAAQRHDLESVILLLEHGAKWEQKNFLGRRPFDGCLKDLLDQCITTNGTPPHSPNHEVIFDYRLFTSASNVTHVHQPRRRSGTPHQNLLNSGRQDGRIHSEMQFFPTLLHYSKGPELLNHPVTASFMHLKWSRIRFMAIYNVVSLIIYLIVLNYHIVQNGKSEPFLQESFIPGGFRTEVFVNGIGVSLPQPVIPLPNTFWPVFSMSVSFFLQEMFKSFLGFRVYWSNPENIINMFTYGAALIVVVPPVFYENYVVQRWIYVLVIMSSSASVVLILGRFGLRQFAMNIEMLKVVIERYLLTSISYLTILVAFALSFHIVFRHISMPETTDADRFQTMPYTIIKMLTMMVGELDSGTIPLEKSTAGTLLFVVFVLGVTVVMQNLLIGLAVSDLETIHSDADRRWHIIRVRTIMDIETKTVFFYNRCCRGLRCICPSLLSTIICCGPLFPYPSASREAVLSPGGPATLRLSSEDSREWPLDPEIVRAATDVLRHRNEQILLLQAGSAETNLLRTNAMTNPSIALARSSSCLGGEHSC